MKREKLFILCIAMMLGMRGSSLWIGAIYPEMCIGAIHEIRDVDKENHKPEVKISFKCLEFLKEELETKR